MEGRRNGQQICGTIGLIIFALTGCGFETVEAPPASPGEPAPEMPAERFDEFVAVSHVTEAGEHGLCTGLVIGPYTVLTHADCASGDLADVSIIAAEDARYGAHIAVADRLTDETTPELAVLVADEPLPTIVAEIADGTLGEQPTETTVIGYGLGGEGPGASVLGVQHEITAQAHRAEVPGIWLSTSSVGLCFGDLGAPILDADGRVVGMVTSVGASCGGAQGLLGRTFDGARGFLTQAADVVPSDG